MKRKADTTIPTASVVKASGESSPTLTEKKSAKMPPIKENVLMNVLTDSQQQYKVVKNVQVTEQLRHCNEILKEMLAKKHLSYAWPFYNPVDINALGLHNYNDIVKNPMDLGTIKVNVVLIGGTSFLDYKSNLVIINLKFRKGKKKKSPVVIPPEVNHGNILKCYVFIFFSSNTFMVIYHNV